MIRGHRDQQEAFLVGMGGYGGSNWNGGTNFCFLSRVIIRKMCRKIS